MPRNDQITRQWLLLRQLESSTRGLTLAQLAEALPPDAPRHLRTLRRDLEALEASGVPLVTNRVDGHVRWRLLEGYRQVPVIPFSPTELMALVVSRRLLSPLQGTQLHGAMESALNKVAAALPRTNQALVGQLQSIFAVGVGSHKTYKTHRATIDQLTDAISRQRTVQLRYYTASRDTTTRREVDPYRLWLAAGGLYLIAYCHLRRAIRIFAIERIRTLTITDHSYQIPLGFDMAHYVQDALTVMRGPRTDVLLVFDKPTAAWVQDRIWHPSQELTRLKDGRLQLRLQVAYGRELIGWILSFGSGVEVVTPNRLRKAVQAEAEIIFMATRP